MAIAQGTTVTRELSSNTVEGINQAIALAFEDNKGYDANGGIQREGGTSQQSTIDFKWRGTQQETKQKFNLSLSDIWPLAFTGHGSVAKVQTATIVGSVEQHSSQSRIELSLGGITAHRQIRKSRPTPSELATVVYDLIREGHWNQFIESVSVSGATITIHYHYSANDISFPSSLKQYNSTLSILSRTWSVSLATVTAFSTGSSGATLTASITNNVALSSSVNPLGITDATRSRSITVADRGNLTSTQIAIIVEQLITTQEGGNNTPYWGSGGLDFTLDSGYALSALTIRVSLVRDGTTTTRESVALFTGADATTYQAAIPESYGTFEIEITDPADSNVYQVPVTIAQNEAITDIESKISSAIHRATTVNGESLSTFVKSSLGAVTDGTDGDGRDVHEFVLTLNWVKTGSAGTPKVDTSQMNDIGSDFDSVTNVSAGSDPSDNDRIQWNTINTSTTLQPGGETTHYASLIFTK